MKKVAVTAVQIVTGLGNSLDETWERLLSGETAAFPVSRFDTANYMSSVGVCVPDLTTGRDGSLMEPLMDRLFDGFSQVPADTQLLTATTKGPIDVLEKARRMKREERWTAGALMQGFVDQAVRRLGLSGGVNISGACASSTVALAHGAGLISSGRREVVLVVAADLLSEFVFSGFSALKVLTRDKCRPFDRDRDGLMLGEGAAAILLMDEGRVQSEGCDSLGRISGWGVANDANHITSPAVDGAGLVMAIRQACETSGISEKEVAAVNTHGTGTVFNELMELAAFKEVFGNHQVPLHSVKGAVGHTLGAAGAIEFALGTRSLASGLLPPTVGFENPEQGAEGLVSDKVTRFSGQNLLCTNSGFGGLNAALLLDKGMPA